MVADDTCGGCLGLGAHRRWCIAVVGRMASYLGGLGKEADGLADMVGSNDPAAANHLYAAAELLGKTATEHAERFRLVARLVAEKEDSRD